MKRIALILCLLLALTAALTALAWAETITIVADEWCPYNCEAGSKQPGFGIEIAQKALAAEKIKVDYRTMDWDKAIEEARKGKFNAIIGAYKDDAPDFVFPDNEFGMASNAFYVRKGDKWRYTDTGSLKDIKIGIIEGYSYGEELDKALKANPRTVTVKGDNALKDLLNKLMKKEIDVVIEDNFVFLLKAREMGMLTKVLNAGRGSSENVYIAFSPANPNSKKYAKIISDGIATMRAKGQLAEILKKYGLEDWK